MLPSDKKLQIRFLLISILSILFFGLLYYGVQWLTTERVVSMEKIADTPADVGAANGVAVYSEGGKLYLQNQAGRFDIFIESFKGSDVALNPDGTLLAFRSSNGCEVWNISSKERLRTEKCLSGLWWMDDESYIFFEYFKKPLGGSDFFEEGSAQLVLSSAVSSERQTQRKVSPNNQVSVIQHQDKSYVVLTTVGENESQVCELQKGQRDIISECKKSEDTITASYSFETMLIGSIRNGSGIQNIDLLGDTIIPTTLSMNKVIHLDRSLYGIDESDPRRTIFSKIYGEEVRKESPKSYTGKRAHGVIQVHQIDEATVLLEATNGLWRMVL